MTLGKVLDIFIDKYNEAREHKYVSKPISWALFYTWSIVDKKEKARKVEEDVRE